MISALISTDSSLDTAPLKSDLETVGITVIGTHECADLLQQTILSAPNLVICYKSTPDIAFFDAIAAVAANAPRPVIMFTTDPDAEKIALATKSGVHAYVVNGYARERLRPLMHLAQARFRHEQRLREELAEVNQRFDERKLLDRAKGILMGARQLREEQAYRALRSAAMNSKRRIGQVAQLVIESAKFGEAINRAGQLRMLSQRLVKLYALAVEGIAKSTTGDAMAEALKQTESNLSVLGNSLSAASFGDLIDNVVTTWTPLRKVLEGTPDVRRLPEVDRLAEQLLLRAEQLTANLEIAGGPTALHVINVCGRQRMLSQRLAKEAFIGPQPKSSTTQSAQVAFENALTYLQSIPLSNAEIQAELGRATDAWREFQGVLAAPVSRARVVQIAELSDTLLAHFEHLTVQYERGMQMLI